MSLQLRPATFLWIALAIALLVGVRSPVWGFRLLLAFVCAGLLLHVLRNNRR
jgi:hypothetical protein